MEAPVSRVAEVWRYPVKSMGGERLDAADVTERGLVDDRRWAVVAPDGRFGSGKSSHRFLRIPGLLSIGASMVDGQPVLTLPDGERLEATDPAASARVSDVVGMSVSIREEAGTPHFDAAPVHLVSDTVMEWLSARHPGAGVERRRFRPNVVVVTDGGHEDDWMGRRLSVGEVALDVVGRTERCVMITMSQPGLGFAPRLLKDLTKAADACLGVYATVAAAGRVRVGDAVVVER